MSAFSRANLTNAAAVLVGILTTLPAAAQNRQNRGAPGTDNVEIQVSTIRATRANTDISPELKKLAEKLKSQFKFTGYKLVKSQTRSVAMGDATTSPLIDPFKVTVTPQKRAEGKIELKVQVIERKGDKDTKKLDTTINLVPEKSQLMGGWTLDGGDSLIIAVSAK